MPTLNLIEADRIVVNEQGGSDSFKLSGSLPNLIRGREVTIIGPNTAPRQNVTIVAQTVIFADGSSIDTSGTPGIPNNPAGLKPATPADDSADGVGGAPGGDATDAGSVDITAFEVRGVVNVTAVGGQGGRGGDGGDGNHATFRNVFPVVAGGAAGQAGTAGRSGDGGNLTVRALDASVIAISADLSGGPQVEPATPGAPGRGSHFDHFDRRGEIDFSRTGPFGRIAPPGVPGPRGRAGNLDKSNIGMPEFAAGCSVNQMRKTLAEGEFDYLNDELRDAFDKFSWVASIAPLVPPGDQRDAIDQLQIEESRTADFEKALPSDPVALGRRADILARQISHGCGYFGHPRNYVSLLRIDFFKNELGQILGDAVTSEDNLQSVIDAAIANQRKDEQLQQALAQCTSLIADLEVQQKEAATQAIQLQDVIRTLEVQAEVQKGRLLADQERFNAAVQEATNGCGLAEVITVVKTIVAVAGAFYTAGGSLALLAVQIGATGFDLFESVKDKDSDGSFFQTHKLNPTYTKIVTAINSIEDVNSKFKSLRDVLDRDPDAGRMVVLQDDMDHLTANFDSKVDAAPVDQSIKDSLKAQAHKYVELIQARNKKILERDGWILKIHQNDAAIVEQRDNAANLSAIRSGTANPPQADYARILLNMQGALRDSLRFLVWQEARALALWTLQPLDVPGGPVLAENLLIIGTKAADLLLLHSRLSAGFLTFEGDQAGPFQPMNPTVVVTINLSEDDAIQFSNSRSFAFTIPRTAFPDFMTSLVVTGVSVSLTEVPSFSGELRHLGRHFFVLPDGQTTVEFSSTPLIVGIQESSAPVTLPLGDSPSGEFFGVSPFSDWILSADMAVTATSLLPLREVSLTFSGRFRARI
jgi:hypothetical protein